MLGYSMITLYILLAGGAVVWLTVGRKVILDRNPVYRRALSVLDRCLDSRDRRVLRVTAPTRAYAGLCDWRGLLSPKQAAALPEMAVRIQSESLAAKRDVAAIVMEAGNSNIWFRSELMQIVSLIEEVSSPDFIVECGYEGGSEVRTIHVPVLSIYLDS